MDVMNLSFSKDVQVWILWICHF